MPAAQSMQVDCPASAYLPASQAMHLELAQSGVVHTKPASIVQVLLHPSPLTTLPSSQASYVFNPSPHAGVQSWHAVALHVCVQQTGQCIRGSVCVVCCVWLCVYLSMSQTRTFMTRDCSSGNEHRSRDLRKPLSVAFSTEKATVENLKEGQHRLCAGKGTLLIRGEYRAQTGI